MTGEHVAGLVALFVGIFILGVLVLDHILPEGEK